MIQHGVFSEFFRIGRGCRQGDPASPYIFLLCVEIMGIMVRENKDITGITLFNNEFKLLQYADDTTILLDGSEKSLRAALTLVDQFSKFSGLKPNYDKTSCIKLGSLKHAILEFETTYNIKWSQDPFSFLGITFTVDLSEIMELNYRQKINDIRKMVNSWSKRNLSTLGRITVVKSLMIPKLTHLFISLPNPQKDLLREIDTLLFNYIWNSKVDRIARKYITRQYNEGGLRMINTHIFIKSLKLTWIRRLERSDSAWALLLRSSLPDWFSSIHVLGNHFVAEISHIINPFWKDVFDALCELKAKVKENVLLTPIWCNECFKINNKYIFFLRWFNRGIICIDDFLDENNNVLSLDDIHSKYNIRIPFVTYYSIVRQLSIIINHEQIVKIERPVLPKYLSILLSDKKGCKNIYNALMVNLCEKPKHEVKWENALHINANQGWWERHYNIPFHVTSDKKLQWLQYRINCRILGTNSYLCKIKIKNSDLCTFCNIESETIVHLFWDCIYVNPILGEFVTWVKTISKQNFELTAVDVILGKLNASAILNLLLILLKLYIYQQRLNNKTPDFTGFLSFLKYYQKLEKHVFQRRQQILQFYTKWSYYLLL